MWRTVAITTGLLVVGGGAIAVAAIPGGDGTLKGCYATNTTLTHAKGDLRVVDDGEACKSYEQTVSWSQRGPKGDPGPPGAASADLIAGPAGEIFLDLEGIPGDSRDEQHSDEIDVLAFDFGATAESGGGAEYTGVQLTKPVDRATPRLLAALDTAQLIPRATITFRRKSSPPFEYLSYRLTDVRVSADRVLTPTSNGGPIERVTLAFRRLDVRHVEQKGDGSAGAVTLGGIEAQP
jgi:type VI secretion system secreted protein Hcp